MLRQQGKLIELAVNGPARRAVRAEGVDIGLHEYVGKRGDRALQGGGQADAYNLPEHRQLDAQPAEEQLIRAVRARQHIQHQHGGQRLRQDGRVSHARNAHVEHQHKDQIARRVDNGRENQKIQRTAAVTHGAQDARAHVIKHQPRHAHKIDAQVGRGLAHHIPGRFHHAQQIGRQIHAKPRKQDGH